MSADQALDILQLMVLEDGSRWGLSAAGFQWRNAEAILDGNDPGQHWIEMPRGARKTTDMAGIVLAALYAQAPRQARVYVGASDEEQAQEVIDAAEGLIERTPELAGIFRVTGLEITCLRTGASMRALAADASAMGKRAWMIILDEVANWPETRKARKFWNTMMSGNRKIAECRTVIITNAGDPAHWAWKRREVARTSPRWRFCAVAGPLPWLTETDLQILRENSEVYSEYERLHLNKWTTAEDRLATREDLDACAVLSGPQPPRAGIQYVATLDVGLTNDRCVATVMHAEGSAEDPGKRTIILDRITRWKGSRDEPVSLTDVRDTVGALATEYNRAAVVVDPYQAKLIAEELRRGGTNVHEFAFTATSVGRLALSLHQAIRQHRAQLPADEDLLEELTAVRLRKNSLGVYRLDHDASGHDDQAVALALGCQWLLDTSGSPQFPILPPVPAAALGGLPLMRPHGRWAVGADFFLPGEGDSAVDRGVKPSPFVAS